MREPRYSSFCRENARQLRAALQSALFRELLRQLLGNNVDFVAGFQRDILFAQDETPPPCEAGNVQGVVVQMTVKTFFP